MMRGTDYENYLSSSMCTPTCPVRTLRKHDVVMSLNGIDTHRFFPFCFVLSIVYFLSLLFLARVDPTFKYLSPILVFSWRTVRTCACAERYMHCSLFLLTVCSE